ncbi:hypothetical protein U1Q18_048137 [Sarracenia purpurea var. burkii]
MLDASELKIVDKMSTWVLRKIKGIRGYLEITYEGYKNRVTQHFAQIEKSWRIQSKGQVKKMRSSSGSRLAREFRNLQCSINYDFDSRKKARKVLAGRDNGVITIVDSMKKINRKTILGGRGNGVITIVDSMKKINTKTMGLIIAAIQRIYFLLIGFFFP